MAREPLREYQQAGAALLYALYGVHFPMSESLPGVDLLRALFNAQAFRGPGRTDAAITPLFRRLMREVFIRYPEEKAEVDIAIESADGNLGIEYEALCLDLAEGGLRRSVPAFDGGLEVSGEAVILADFETRPLVRVVILVPSLCNIGDSGGFSRSVSWFRSCTRA